MNGDVVIPEHLMSKMPPPALEKPDRRYTWLSNEEIAAILVNFPKHVDWLSVSRVHRPENGSLLMFNRKKVKYRQDMYTWKTKRKSKWPREDHVKLKVEGIPCITALYVHSDIMPTFHRRCYWFIQNPDVVLVHYLNFPYIEGGNHVVRDFSLNHQCQQWQDLAREDVIEQLKPMFADMPWPKLDADPLTRAEGEVIISKLVEKHFSDFSNQNNVDLIAGRIKLRTIKPKALSAEDTKRFGTPIANNIPIACQLPTSVATYQLVSNGCIPHNGKLQLATTMSTVNSNGTVLVLSNGNLTQCQLVQAELSPQKSPVQNLIKVDRVPTVTTNNCQTANGCLTGKVNFQSSSQNHHQNSPSFIDIKDVKEDNPEILFNSENFNPVTYPTVQHLTNRHGAVGDISVNSTPMLNHSIYNMSSCLEDFGGNKNEDQTKVKEGLYEEKTRQMLPNEAMRNYGVNDPMVPNCRMVSSFPEPSPFADPNAVSQFNNNPSLDVFDVESLFNVSSSTVSTSLDSSDPNNSSTESAVSDLFPKHLWEHNLDRVDADALESPSLLSQASSPLNNLQSDLPLNGLSSISDFSPDWSYTEGGIKILVAGRWSRSGNYQCVFGDVAVPAINLQIGVLRCYCPAHTPGHVSLRVTCDGQIITNSVQFEYKTLPTQYSRLNADWLQLNENEFKMSILERLERMEEHLNALGSNHRNRGGDGHTPTQLQYGLHFLNLDLPTAARDAEPSTSKPRDENRGISSFVCNPCSNATSQLQSSTTPFLDFEERLIQLCQKINGVFNSNNAIAATTAAPRCTVPPETRKEGLTVLHYSAALGYSKLVAAVRSMRLESDNAFVKSECDPQNVDKFDCTPLMWASACGQLACAESLCRWSSEELRSLDVLGRSPAVVARQRGHSAVCNRLEMFAGRHNGSPPSEQEEADDADTSSIGDTTISGTLDTIDSGEDSMETDDSFLWDPFPGTPFSQSSNFAASRTLQVNSPIHGGPTFARENDGVSWERDEMLSDDHSLGTGECVAALAEQIVENAPEYVKRNGGNLLAPSNHADLTLRNFPQFVNSHCATSSYFGSQQNQQPQQPHQQQQHQQPEPGSSLLNWGEFLQLPPRDIMTSHSAYQNSFELQLDALRLTEHEQRQLFIAATTVLNAYHCEGLALNGEVLRASLLIKGCYKKYKKFAVSKKMNEAAVLIQSKFRSYQEQKRFQRSRHAAILIQSFYRSYKYTRNGEPGPARSSKHTVKLIEDALRGHMTKKRQHQAARKIQRFLRRCQYRLRHQDLADEARNLSSCMKGFYAC